MALPDFDNQGELPEGIHQATIDEVAKRFGHGTPQRQTVTTNLLRIYHLAKATNKLDRLIIFGSYVTAKPSPNDVDVVLVFKDEFNFAACDEEMKKLLDHSQADKAFGASVFWIRPSLIILETLEQFITHWQIKRDQTFRGIVEVRP